MVMHLHFQYVIFSLFFYILPTILGGGYDQEMQTSEDKNIIEI